MLREWSDRSDKPERPERPFLGWVLIASFTGMMIAAVIRGNW